MTTPIADTIARREAKAPACTLFGDIADVGAEMAVWRSRLDWPSERYQTDPVGFARDVLGVEPWSKQIEILEAVRDNPRTAVRSGHKCGKSMSAAILALWFFACFVDARIVMTCVTARQVDEILYREVKKLHEASGTCLACRREAEAEKRKPPRPCEHSTCLDGDRKILARSGIRTADHRQIVGFTAREPEGVAGVSGANILYIIDEASGVPEAIYEAIDGNTAAGAKVVLISNPTRTEGQFYRAFHKEREHWATIHVSSEDTPNAKAGRTIVKGLAGRPWIERKRAIDGEKSAEFLVRVLGEFPTIEEGRTLSIGAIEDAQNRWEIASTIGRLSVGLDPAGDGGDGDEIAMTAVRGAKQLSAREFRGETPEAIRILVVDYIDENRSGTEIPRLVVDIEGEVGWNVYRELRDYLESHPGTFELVGVRAGKRARQHEFYKTVRDELWASLVRWVQHAGIVLDEKLQEELHAPMWVKVTIGEGTIRPRKVRMLTPKKELRVKLGRSPDRADALALAVWDAGGTDEDLAVDAGPVAKPRAAVDLDEDLAEGGAMDPFAGRDVWGSS